MELIHPISEGFSPTVPMSTITLLETERIYTWSQVTSKSGYRSFTYSAAKLFNNLDHATKCSLTIEEFVNNY